MTKLLIIIHNICMGNIGCGSNDLIVRGLVMKSTLKILVVVIGAVVTTGCKIAVINVEGGEVLSVTSGTCIEGTVCIHQVNDTNFTETFTAEPHAGWAFVKWNSGDSFLCADSADPACRLSLAEVASNEGVEALVESNKTFYLMPMFTLIADCPPLDQDGRSYCAQANDKQWLNPAAFYSSTWNDVNSVCPPPGGMCEGTLDSIDVTGYTWASLADIDALMISYGMATNPEIDSAWGAAFYSDFGGARIIEGDSDRHVVGYVRDGGAAGVSVDADLGGEDVYRQDWWGGINPDQPAPFTGVWLWRIP